MSDEGRENLAHVSFKNLNRAIQPELCITATVNSKGIESPQICEINCKRNLMELVLVCVLPCNLTIMFSALFKPIRQTGPDTRFMAVLIPLVEHNRYGVMGAFSRFAPLTFDSIPFENAVFHEAELSISKSTISFNKTREYKRMRLFYGNAKSPVDLKLFVNGEMVFSETLKHNLDYDVVSCDLPDSQPTM
jgi:hypothetical protein